MAVYVLSSRTCNVGSYKVGFHDGDFESLISQYIIYIPDIEIRHFVKTLYAFDVNEIFWSIHKSCMIINANNLHTEWVKLPIDYIYQQILLISGICDDKMKENRNHIIDNFHQLQNFTSKQKNVESHTKIIVDDSKRPDENAENGPEMFLDEVISDKLCLTEKIFHWDTNQEIFYFSRIEIYPFYVKWCQSRKLKPLNEIIFGEKIMYTDGLVSHSKKMIDNYPHYCSYIDPFMYQSIIVKKDGVKVELISLTPDDL